MNHSVTSLATVCPKSNSCIVGSNQFKTVPLNHVELTQFSKGFETMKSMLFSALVIFALATTGCALQSGAGGCSDGLCGNQSAGCDDCMVLSGDCNCGAPKGLKPSCNIMRCLTDSRGMGLRVNQKGSACNQGRNNGLFSRMSQSSSVAPAASMDCGCGGGAGSGGACGCGSGGAMAGGAGAGDCGCNAGDSVISMSDAGCGCDDAGAAMGGGSASTGGLLGKLGTGGCSCKLGKCLFGGGAGAGAAASLGGGCGVQGCGMGGKLCGGCLSKMAGAHRHPYGGTIPHTAQAPGAGTGMAPAYAYPYYTTRGPRDFLMKNPPSIGY